MIIILPQETFDYLFDLLYQAIILVSDDDDPNFIYIGSLTYLRYLILLVQRKILYIPIKIEPPTAGQHFRLIFMQSLLLFFSFYQMLKLYKLSSLTETFLLFICLQYFCSFCDCLFDITRHFLILYDRKNQGNSRNTFFSIHSSEIFFSIPSSFLKSLFFLYQFRRSPKESRIYLFIPILKSFNDIYQKIQFSSKLHQSRTILQKRLRKALSKDLEGDDMCPFCRLKMFPLESIKLPCHHCLHFDCLEQWLTQKFKCPICEYDLSPIFLNPENENLVFYKDDDNDVKEETPETTKKIKRNNDENEND